MKYVRILCAVALVFALCSAFTMKDKEKAVYAFGVAASFNDSIVYYTDIQVLDSVELDKNGFLPKRDLYTYQLKNYLEYNLKKPDYTCMIYFAENKKKLEKEAVKVKGKYKKSKNMVLQVVKLLHLVRWVVPLRLILCLDENKLIILRSLVISLIC